LVKVAYKEGQDVHAGDLLCEIDPRPFQAQLAQDEGALERDQALLENAQLELDRYEQAKEAIPQQTIDTQRATVLQDQGNVKTDQAQVDSTKLNLTYCEIASPIDGRVGLRLVDQGNQISANSTLVVVTQVQPITAVFNLPENNIPQVAPKWHEGQQGLAAVAYDPSLTKQLATGSLLAFDNQVNQNAGTFQLKAIFSNEDGALFPNQFVNVRLLVDTLPKMVVVPTSAVQIGPQSSFVYVIKADKTVEQRTVTPGHIEGDLEAITKGLNDGELVVTDGFDKLQPGLAVSVTPPDAPAAEKSASSK
jgi:multidrug efflux system membrane fusion protein